MTMQENNSEKVISAESNKSITVAQFLEGKNVFITGGTGFLGTLLIERLLNSTPKIGKIYLLVRAKHGVSPECRIQRLMSKVIFDKLNDDDKAKVIPVVGELSEANFGIVGDLLEKLLMDVNIVYHVAATIRFNAFLGDAIKTNLVGTQVAVNFAKQLHNLVSFIYVSTAFCNSCYLNQGIKEQVYPSHHDPHEMIKLVDDNNNETKELPKTGTKELQEILGIHPNTYTFTKQLAENLILKEMRNLPAGIIRPSIVYGTYKDPDAGWVGSANNGHIGFLAGFTKGLFRTMGGDPDSVMDLIPCDYVVNSTIVLSWYVGKSHIETPEVIHCTSGEINPLTFGKYCRMLNKATKAHPNDYIICQPKVKVRNGFRYMLFTYLFHYIPALLLYIPEMFLHSSKKSSRRTIEYVRIFDNGIKAFDFFVSQNFHYNMKNSLRILGCLEPEDAQKYNYNVEFCDWANYFETQIIGVRYYFYKESKKTSVWHRIMWHTYGVVQFLWYVVAFIWFKTILSLFFSTTVSVTVSLLVLLFVKWI
ncbi:CLUMA_CG010976, isoform A [Clunio marinus]|uniref:Fatty acyl-CoA reductase n=1 Tax=Clunio marinus TaxID=568069 RepID=A0A1J1IF15_9DIPT|nr:CLUMA_CG010976, isoform A [Clunio marinus]